MNSKLALATSVALLAAALAGCATPTQGTTPGGVPIDLRYTARGQDSRALFLILHYTVADTPLSIKILTQEEVSSHYLLSDDEKPVVYRLVDESRRAWHSGPSFWKGHGMLNASSIGIEIVHPGFRARPDGSREYLPFPKAQIDALIPLVKDIVQRHAIRPERTGRPHEPLATVMDHAEGTIEHAEVRIKPHRDREVDFAVPAVAVEEIAVVEVAVAGCDGVEGVRRLVREVFVCGCERH